MQMTVNSLTHVFDGDSETPLLWFLRDRLNMTSVKYGCGQGLCGACSCHVDGKLTRSCSVSCEEVRGQQITTIEGLPTRLGNALTRAWTEVDVPQCGYCQPGMIMAAAALLAVNPRPSDAEVTEAMNKNLCRCGTYARIRKAIQLAASRLEASHTAATKL